MASPSEVTHPQYEHIDTILSVLEATAERIALYQATPESIGAGQHLRGPSPNAFHMAVEQTFRSVSELLHGIGGLPMAYEDEKTSVPVVLSAFIINHYNPGSERWQMVATSNHKPPVEGFPAIHLECSTAELRTNYMNFQQAIVERTPLHPREP